MSLASKILCCLAHETGKYLKRPAGLVPICVIRGAVLPDTIRIPCSFAVPSCLSSRKTARHPAVLISLAEYSQHGVLVKTVCYLWTVGELLCIPYILVSWAEEPSSGMPAHPWSSLYHSPCKIFRSILFSCHAQYQHWLGSIPAGYLPSGGS